MCETKRMDMSKLLRVLSLMVLRNASDLYFKTMELLELYACTKYKYGTNVRNVSTWA